MPVCTNSTSIDGGKTWTTHSFEANEQTAKFWNGTAIDGRPSGVNYISKYTCTK